MARILYLNHNVAWSGGTFFRAYQFARQMVRRGHRVTLFTISPTRRHGFTIEHREGVELVHTPDLLTGRGRTGWDPWDVLNRVVRLRGEKWDLVHAWDSRPAVILPALYACNQCGSSPLVMDWCDWWGRGGTQSERPGGVGKLLSSPVETYFEEAFRRRATATTVISSALADRARGLGVPAKTIHLLPQGCDTEGPALGDRQAARERLGYPVEAPLLLSVGALTTSEAQLLFTALRLLFVRRKDLHFVMVGKHGASIPTDLAKHPRLANVGFVAEEVLRSYMAACDALLVPLAPTVASRARWPSKANPFLSAGRTVIITRVGDLAAALQRENAAVVCAPTADDITERTMEFLETVNLRAEYEERGRRVAAETLAWPVLAQQLEHVYQSTRGR